MPERPSPSLKASRELLFWWGNQGQLGIKCLYPKRFMSRVHAGDHLSAEDMGRSRKDAAQDAPAASVQRLIGSETGSSTEPH